MDHPVPTAIRAILQLSSDTAIFSLAWWWTPPPPSVQSCHSHRTYLQWTLQEVTSQDEIFMPSTDGYIRESVNDWDRLHQQEWQESKSHRGGPLLKEGTRFKAGPTCTAFTLCGLHIRHVLGGLAWLI